MIEINNLTTNPVDEEFLKKIAKKVLEEELEISKYRVIHCLGWTGENKRVK